MVVCHYCNNRAELVTGERVYPHRRDLWQKKFWFCENGHEPAYVGCHGKKGRPLGILADSNLRRWKMAAHKSFDPIWRYGKYSRDSAYLWLSEKLEINKSDCHIGMFDVDMCKKVISAVNGNCGETP